MDFSEALLRMKMGAKIARQGWNGQGMWLTMSPGNGALPADKFWSSHNREHAEKNGGAARVNPCVTMKGADGSITMGWAPSQPDIFAEDWVVVG